MCWYTKNFYFGVEKYYTVMASAAKKKKPDSGFFETFKKREFSRQRLEGGMNKENNVRKMNGYPSTALRNPKIANNRFQIKSEILWPKFLY